MYCHLKGFSLETPMPRAECMRIHSKYFPPDIISLYQIDGVNSEDKYVYTKIIKGMYGLKQGAIIDFNQLISHMDTYVYYLLPFTTELWAHKTRKTKNLCVDDSGVKHFNKDNADHLIEFLKNHYGISTYWKGRTYLGLKINWNYSNECVDVLMIEYVKKVIDRLHHPKSERPQYSPHSWTVPTYGKILQMAPNTNEK